MQLPDYLSSISSWVHVSNKIFQRKYKKWEIDKGLPFLHMKGAVMETVHKCKDGQCHEENHLCRVILRKDLGRVKEIVKDAHFFCKNCGRAAHDEANLCNPSKI